MRAVPRAADKRALLRSKVGAHSRRRHLRYRALSRVPAVWEVPGAPAEFQVGADSHANFPCSFFGGGAGNPGESSGASQPHTSSLRLSHPERAGAAEPAVPLLTRPGALAWAETSPRAQSAFSHLLCLVGLKGNRSSSQVEQQSRASCIQDACRYEQSKLHRILVL